MNSHTPQDPASEPPKNVTGDISDFKKCGYCGEQIYYAHFDAHTKKHFNQVLRETTRGKSVT